MKVLLFSLFLFAVSFCTAQKRLDSVVVFYDSMGNMTEKKYYSETPSMAKVKKYILFAIEGLKPKTKWAY